MVHSSVTHLGAHMVQEAVIEINLVTIHDHHSTKEAINLTVVMNPGALIHMAPKMGKVHMVNQTHMDLMENT